MSASFSDRRPPPTSVELTLDHFEQSQQFETAGDLEDARYELATAEEYRDMYWYRTEREDSR